MPKTIISDTSCLILLDKIGEIEILKKLFGQAVITAIIAQEFYAVVSFYANNNFLI